MTLKGDYNSRYIDLIESVVDDVEKSAFPASREVLYNTAQLILRRLARHYTEEEVLEAVRFIKWSGKMKKDGNFYGNTCE